MPNYVKYWILKTPLSILNKLEQNNNLPSVTIIYDGIFLEYMYMKSPGAVASWSRLALKGFCSAGASNWKIWSKDGKLKGFVNIIDVIFLFQWLFIVSYQEYDFHTKIFFLSLHIPCLFLARNVDVTSKFNRHLLHRARTSTYGESFMYH